MMVTTAIRRLGRQRCFSSLVELERDVVQPKWLGAYSRGVGENGANRRALDPGYLGSFTVAVQYPRLSSLCLGREAPVTR